jgi:transcriptional regulator with XRE-family HTH domain
MLPWLAQVLAERRLRAGVRQETIASDAGCSMSKIDRLEDAQAWPRAPKDIDAIIDAYAQRTAATPFELWAAALERWREHDADPARQFAAEAEQAAPPPDEHESSREEDPRDEDAEDADR